MTIKTQQGDIEVREDVSRQQTDDMREPDYEVAGDQDRQVDIGISPECIDMTTDSNQYERPTVYVNMVDRRNEYESLNG